MTVTGNGFGGTQGNGVVWIGNMAGVVSGWSNTQVVASVAPNAVSGIVQVQQNGTWSNAVTFTVPVTVGQGTQVTLVPNVFSMVVGDSRTIQALDSNGNAVTGLTWISSDTTVVTLSSDDPPIIAAIAAGNVTITAGSASADVTVYAGPTLPTGTVVWTNPGDSSGVSNIMPAVPSSTGVADVFAQNSSGVVQAITSDGTEAWRISAFGGSTLLPDFQGGLIVADSVSTQSVRKYDGTTGVAKPPIPYTGGQVLVHTDGTLFVMPSYRGQSANQISLFDPVTGSAKPSPTLPSGTYSWTTCPDPGQPASGSGTNFAGIGQAIIAGDGYLYVPYSTTSTVSNVSCDNTGAGQSTYQMGVFRVGSDGSATDISLGSWSSSCVIPGGCAPYSVGNIGTLITNADQGVMYSWQLFNCDGMSNCTSKNQLTTIYTDRSTSTTTLNVPGHYVQPTLQRADGSYIGTCCGDYIQNGLMVAFTSSGQPLWSQPNDTPRMATVGGGITGASGMTYDRNGNANGQVASGITQSWLGYTYQASPSLSLIANASMTPDPSFSPFQHANQSVNDTAKQQVSADLILRYGSNLTVSPTNGKADVYQEDIGTSLLGMQSGKQGVLQQFCVAGNELAATVTPRTFPGPVTIKRFVKSQSCYSDQTQYDCGVSIGDDTGGLLTTNPQLQTAGGNANGQVFNLDLPGFSGSYVTFSSVPLRDRVNFEAYAVGPDNNTQISRKIKYYVRLSCVSNSQGVPYFSTVPNISNDNQIGFGVTPTTWNLK